MSSVSLKPFPENLSKGTRVFKTSVCNTPLSTTEQSSAVKMSTSNRYIPSPMSHWPGSRLRNSLLSKHTPFFWSLLGCLPSQIKTTPLTLYHPPPHTPPPHHHHSIHFGRFHQGARVDRARPGSFRCAKKVEGARVRAAYARCVVMLVCEMIITTHAFQVRSCR